MKPFIGTSGYSHAEWKGNFYPEKFSPKKMLEFYAQHFPTVEVNYTFRQLPTPKVVEAWAQQAPDSFRFVLKGSQSITHFKRLRNAEKETDDFLAVASVLQKRLGPILLQLPPNFKKDVSRLDAFLKHIAGRAKVAFEFRNATWFDDEVFECLRSHSAVLCVSDRDDLPETGLVHTANWGYVRLWNDTYTDKRLHQLSEDINSQKWTEGYVIFMHEDEGISPQVGDSLYETMRTVGCFGRHVGEAGTRVLRVGLWGLGAEWCGARGFFEFCTRGLRAVTMEVALAL